MATIKKKYFCLLLLYRSYVLVLSRQLDLLLLYRSYVLVLSRQLATLWLYQQINDKEMNKIYYYYYYYHHHHLLYAGYLYLYSRDKLCPYGIQCCSYSVVTIHGAYIVSFSVDYIVIYCIIITKSVFPPAITTIKPRLETKGLFQ